jgi:Tetratricopeptide repeat
MLKSRSSEASIQERLSEVNAAVSRRTETPQGKIVSEGCYVASLSATGRGSSRPFVTDEQKGDIIPPETEELFRRLGVQLNRGTGPDGRPLPLRVVGSTFVKSSGSREYFRQQFKLQPDNAELWNNYGAFLARQRKFDEAMDAYERALALDPSYAIAIANLAKQYWLHRNDVSEADRLYRKALGVGDRRCPRGSCLTSPRSVTRDWRIRSVLWSCTAVLSVIRITPWPRRGSRIFF